MANNIKESENIEKKSGNTISRKNFFKYAGASAVGAVAFGLSGCDDDGPSGPPMEDAVNLGSGDTGILNFAFALEQLEAAFYIMATDQNGWMQEGDGAIFEDIRDHEIAHRDWFSAVIGSVAGADARIPALTPNFDSVDFSDRASVLQTAQALEDTGVRAYNGAGHLIENPDYLVQAGKIVSVEARHASSIRFLIDSASFYGEITAETGLDGALSPADVLGIAGGFIDDQIDASGLPQPADVYL